MSSKINGMIYCIKSKHTDRVYVGSTEKTLDERFKQHKKDYKVLINGGNKYISSFEIVKYDDCWIELLELCECESKDILRRLEGEFIKKMNCVNKLVAGRTQQEYRETNKDKIKEWFEKNKEKIKEYNKEYKEVNKEKLKEKNKEYREKNKEKIKESRQKNKEKVKCECGSIVRRDCLSRHKKSNKHKKLMDIK